MRTGSVRMVRAVMALAPLVVVLALAAPADAASVPGAPAAGAATLVGRDVSLTWAAPASDGGSPITGYQVRSRWEGQGIGTRTFDASTTTRLITDLPADGDVTFEVAAVNALGTSGWSPQSAPVSWTSTPPDAPTGVTAVHTGSSDTVRINLTPPTNTNGAPVTGYRVTVYIGGVAQGANAGYGTFSTHLYSGLTANATYTFTVAAANKRGFGPESAPTAPYKADTTPGPPAAPQIFTAKPGDSKAYLTWSGTSDFGGGVLLGYDITPYRNGVALPVQRTTGSALSATVTGLTNETDYRFTVAARNAAGPGYPSPLSTTVRPISLWKPFATPEAFVKQQYADLLGRPATAAEVSSWSAKLRADTTVSGALAHSLRLSADHTGNVDPVTRLYFAYFLRVPDRGGLVYWIGKKRAGQSLSSISSTFAGSAEFRRRYGAMSNRAFVERIYTALLERTPDPSGVAYWTKQLDTGKKSRGQVMIGFSESNEYKRGNASEVTVVIAYALLLGRSPTNSEFNSQSDALDRGKDDTELFKQIYLLPAYAQRVS